MSKQKANYSEEQILDILKSEYDHAYAYKETYAEDYSAAWRYYRGMLPFDSADTGVDPVCAVRDRVDEYFQILKPMFTGSDNSSVRIKSRHMDAKKANALSEAINAVVIDMNEFPRKLEAWLKETLLWGAGHMKVYLNRRLLDECDHSFEDWEQEHLDSYLSLLKLNGYNDVDVKIKSTKTRRPTKREREEAQKIGIDRKSIKLFTGTIKAIAEEIFPAVDYIPFSDIYINSTTQYSLDESPYVCHKYNMSINNGMLNGWSMDKMKAGVDLDMSDPSFATTGLNVGKQFNPFDVTGAGITPIDATNNFVVYEHYLQIAYKGKLPKIWKFITTNHELLEDPIEVDEMPFISARVMEIPNSFYGLGVYHTDKRYQDVLTLVERMTTYTANVNALGRMTAIKDAYDPEALTDLRKGGVVEIYEPNAIQVLPVADISSSMQFLYNNIINGYKEESADLGGAQNASKMARTGAMGITSIINKQEQAPRSMAATFADTGLIPLYRKVYKLLRAMKMPVTELNAETFADFPKTIGMSFDVSTSDDKAAIAQNLISVMNEGVKIAAGKLPKCMSDETIYNSLAYAVQAITGQSDVSAFLTDPSTIKPTPIEIDLGLAAVRAKKDAIEAAGVGAKLDNEYKLAQIRKEGADTALALAQAEKYKADTEVELGVNANSTQVDTALKLQQLSEAPARLALESVEVQSGVIAEQANILNDQYATGANVNVQ
ncbi:portal protein [Klebsiella variicola]|uniref:portal protein n=1 Tax=Klebsiella variicola TaxID=244366 RepID=UPI003CFC07E9